jgi:hypothetical protein
MPRIQIWSQSVPRVELDQRSREARRRLEQMEKLLLWRAAVRQSRLRRVLYFFRVNIHRGAPEERRARGPLSDRRPSRCSTLSRRSQAGTIIGRQGYKQTAWSCSCL